MARTPVREKPLNALREPDLPKSGIEITEEDVERLLLKMGREESAEKSLDQPTSRKLTATTATRPATKAAALRAAKTRPAATNSVAVQGS